MYANYAAMLDNSGCFYKFFREENRLDTLSQLIGKEVEQAVDAVQLAERLPASTEGQVAARATELRRLSLELERARSRKKSAMQDFLAGTLTWTEHERLKSCLAEEIERLNGQITALRSEQQRQSETMTVCYNSGWSNDADRAAFKKENRRLFQESG